VKYFVLKPNNKTTPKAYLISYTFPRLFIFLHGRSCFQVTTEYNPLRGSAPEVAFQLKCQIRGSA